MRSSLIVFTFEHYVFLVHHLPLLTAFRKPLNVIVTLRKGGCWYTCYVLQTSCVLVANKGLEIKWTLLYTFVHSSKLYRLKDEKKIVCCSSSKRNISTFPCPIGIELLSFVFCCVYRPPSNATFDKTETLMSF